MADPGIGVGAGGMIASLFNPGLASNVAQHITPNPNPLAQQGQPGDGTVDSLGNPTKPNLAQPAVTQPDPANAPNVAKLANPPDSSYATDMMRYQRMNELSNSFNHSLQGIAAGFGTAQQQAAKQNALRGDGTVGGGIGDLAGIQKMQDQTIEDNRNARFMGNAAIFAQILRNQGINVTDAQATELMNNKGLLDQFGGAAAGNATQTGAVKDADAATAAWAAANPKATPKEIADYKANLIAGGMGGSDLGQRQYLAEKAAGLTTDDYLTWKSKHEAAGHALETQSEDAQKFKDSATSDYTSANTKLTGIQQYIDTLNKDPASAKEALATPWPTSGVYGAWNPLVPQRVRDAAVALDKIRSTLSAEALSNTKNVRNIQEFKTLGQAATAGLNPAASDKDFGQAITDLKNRYLDAQATLEMTVGHKLTGELVGHGNRDLLQPTINGKPNPYYNGATEEEQPDFSKMSTSDADKAYDALPSGSIFTDTDGKRKKKP